MKNCLVFLLFFLGLGLNSSKIENEDGAHAPLLGFHEGEYLGLGEYVTSDNAAGTYASHAEIYEDEWHVNYLRDYGFSSYSLYFEFEDNGFFTVALFEHNNHKTTADKKAHDDDQVYYGIGYCQSVQCHIEVDMGERKFEETITFATWEDKIYRLGSLSKAGEDGVFNKVLTWQEVMNRIDDGSDIVPQPEPVEPINS